MKDTLKRIAFAIFASLFVLTSCTQLTDPVTVYSGNGDKNVEVGETTNITINVSSSSEIIKFNTQTVARTIAPEAIDGASGGKFYIWGKNTISKVEFGPAEIEFSATDGTNGKKGTVTRLFERSSYELYLAFVLNDSMEGDVSVPNIETYAALTANTDVDLRYNEKVYFYLTPNKASSQGGTVSLKVYADGWTPADFSDYTMKIGLYSLDNLETSKAEVTSMNGALSTTLPPTTIPTSANWVTPTTVPAGTYEFRVDFKKGDKTYSASEDIIVLANQTTEGEFPIPDIIEKKPEAPTNFSAAFLDPSTSLENATFYNVALFWNETNIINESNFELEIFEYPATAPKDGVLPTNEEKWNQLKTSYTSAKVITYDNKGTEDGSKIKWIGSDKCTIYYEGDLNKNSTYVVMQVLLGSRYAARIRAVNDAGESAWCYVTLPTNISTGSTIIPEGIENKVNYKAFPANSKTINRYKLRYNLNGGKEMKYDSTDKKLVDLAAGDPKINLVTFHSYTGVSEAIVTPERSIPQTTPENGKYIVTEYNGNFDYWQYWYNGDSPYTTDNGDGKPENAGYDDFKNLTLTASYISDSDMDVTLIQPADYIIQSTHAKIEFYKDNDTTPLDPQPALSKGKYKVSLAAANKFKLSLVTPYQYQKVEYSIARTNGNTEEFVYDTKVTSAGDPTIMYTYTSDTTDNGLISFQSLLPGIYEVQWKAWHSTRGNTPYTYHVYIEITE